MFIALAFRGFYKKVVGFFPIIFLSRPISGYWYIPCHTIGKGSNCSPAGNIAGREVEVSSLGYDFTYRFWAVAN